jgi:hypothetical protein
MWWALLKLRNVFQSIPACERGDNGSHIQCTMLLIYAVTFVLHLSVMLDTAWPVKF